MSLDWMDVTQVSFQSLLLLERLQLSWFPGWGFPEPQMSLALEANPAVAWYLRRKCPEIGAWVDGELARATEVRAGRTLAAGEVRQAEVAVLARMVDLLVYALDPAAYDRLPFLDWDSNELTDLVDFRGKRVIDVGAGTGRLAFAVAHLAQVVWAVEPVGNLRHFMLCKARAKGLGNFYAVDGTITAIPFPDGFAGVVMAGHVFGDDPQAEEAEMARVAGPGGMVILCPGSDYTESGPDKFLVGKGYAWAEFIEPPADRKCKYWKTV